MENEPMHKLTEKYIFECKLKGVPVEFDTDILYHEGILRLLTTTGVWEKDIVGSNKFWKEFAFTIRYPVRMIDDDGKANLLLEGYHHTVCL
jgi:hypothetical protein